MFQTFCPIGPWKQLCRLKPSPWLKTSGNGFQKRFPLSTIDISQSGGNFCSTSQKFYGTLCVCFSFCDDFPPPFFGPPQYHYTIIIKIATIVNLKWGDLVAGFNQIVILAHLGRFSKFQKEISAAYRLGSLRFNFRVKSRPIRSLLKAAKWPQRGEKIPCKIRKQWQTLVWEMCHLL